MFLYLNILKVPFVFRYLWGRVRGSRGWSRSGRSRGSLGPTSGGAGYPGAVKNRSPDTNFIELHNNSHKFSINVFCSASGQVELLHFGGFGGLPGNNAWAAHSRQECSREGAAAEWQNGRSEVETLECAENGSGTMVGVWDTREGVGEGEYLTSLHTFCSLFASKRRRRFRIFDD